MYVQYIYLCTFLHPRKMSSSHSHSKGILNKSKINKSLNSLDYNALLLVIIILIKVQSVLFTVYHRCNTPLYNSTMCVFFHISSSIVLKYNCFDLCPLFKYFRFPLHYYIRGQTRLQSSSLPLLLHYSVSRCVSTTCG